MKETNEAYMNS